jgi:hypothetical protein
MQKMDHDQGIVLRIAGQADHHPCGAAPAFSNGQGSSRRLLNLLLVHYPKNSHSGSSVCSAQRRRSGLSICERHLQPMSIGADGIRPLSIEIGLQKPTDERRNDGHRGLLPR